MRKIERNFFNRNTQDRFLERLRLNVWRQLVVKEVCFVFCLQNIIGLIVALHFLNLLKMRKRLSNPNEYKEKKSSYHYFF